MQLLPLMRFRHHPDDWERYGDEWYTCDESAMVRLPLSQLREIQQQIGMSLPAMIDYRRKPEHPRWLDAMVAQMWISRRLAGIEERYEEYEPIVLLSTWEEVGDADPPEEKPSPSSGEG